MGLVAGVFLFFLLLLVALLTFNICQEYERAVIFRLGRFARVSGPGFFLTWPFIETRTVFDLRVVTADIPRQETMTADNVPIKVQAVVWYKVKDAKAVRLNVLNHKVAVVEAASTNLRTVLGQNTLKDIMGDQQKVAAELQKIIDDVTEPWGVGVDRVQLKDVEIPASMQRAMAQVAEAGRERDARVIKASAEREATEQFAKAAATLVGVPGALELRRLQTLQEIGAEQNTMMLVPFPVELAQVLSTAATHLAGKAVVPPASEPAQTAPQAA